MVFEGGMSSVRGEGAMVNQVRDELVIQGEQRRDIEGDGVFHDKSDVGRSIDHGRSELGSGGGIHG